MNKMNTKAYSVGLGLSLLMFGSVSANASALNKGVTFGGLVSSDANLPAIKIYEAEVDVRNGAYDAAVMHYMQAVKDGQVAAAFNIASIVEKNAVSGDVLKSSIKQLSSLAVSDSNVAYFLGVYYKEISKKPNETESFKWFNASLSMGNTDAAPFVAGYITSGLKAASQMYTHDNAASMLKLSADKGDFESAYKLASMVYGDPLVVKNMHVAFKYYTQASKHEYMDSLYMLGYMNEYGISKTADVAVAVRMFKQSLESASVNEAFKAKSANQLARIYMYGKGNVQQDRLQGILYLSKAAKLGSIDANTKIGLLNLYGADDYKVNVDSAIGYLKVAASGGSKIAMNTLFQIYENGMYGVPVNNGIASEYKLKLLNL